MISSSRVVPGILLSVTSRRVPVLDALLGLFAVATAVLGWVAAFDGDHGVHRMVAAACFTAAALAVPVRRTAVTLSAWVTIVAFTVLAATGSADALGVFPLILCVPLTVAAVVGHAERTASGVGVLLLACVATPLSPAVTIAANRPLMIGLHLTVLVAVYLWASRRRLERENVAAERERAVARATADERQRIADDLHDGLGQALTAIRATSSTAVALARSRPEAAVDALGTVAELSRESLLELRRSVAEISDVASLDEIVDRARRTGRDVRCATDDAVGVDAVDESLPHAVRDAVRRILREALTNAVRHGAPGAPVIVEFSRTGGRGRATEVRMRVDNEIAVTTGGVDHISGRGCATMRRRAESVGGRCTLGPCGDRWVVELEVPIGTAR